MHIIYCIDNKLGGVSSLNYNLSANCNNSSIKQTVLHIFCKEWEMSNANLDFPVDENLYFNYSASNNYYHTLKRLHQLIPDEEGVLVINYDTEMAMLDHYSVKQTVYQLVHDDYNVGLAKKYCHIVDAFICHNSAINNELKTYFTNRQQDVYFLPHGVPVPELARQSPRKINKPLQLLFLGRMAASKGIFDLPVISNLLQEQGIDFEWTCIGNGPELEALKKNWVRRDHVKFYQPQTNKEVLDICAGMDVFVLPTKFEGSPVSLIEAMSVGLVPVISDLPGGITDIVSEDIGFRIPVDDNKGFADAIIKLDRNRPLLDMLSVNCRNRIIEQYDVKKTAIPYHELFSKYKELYKKKELKKLKVGARLDQAFIPSFATRLIRSIFNKTS